MSGERTLKVVELDEPPSPEAGPQAQAEAGAISQGELEGGESGATPEAPSADASHPSAPLPIPEAEPSAVAPAPGTDLAGRPLRLHHFPNSIGSQIVRLALAEKELEWTGLIVNTGPANEHFEPDYAKLNPRLAVPTLELGDTVVTQTVDILRVLDEAAPSPRLLPREQEPRAEVMRWVERQDQFPILELQHGRSKGLVSWFHLWAQGRERKRLRQLIKKEPDLAEVYRAKLDELTAFKEAIGDRALVDQLVVEVEDLFDELEILLSERRWLAGDEYSLADLVWTATIARLDHIGFTRSLSERRHPRLAEWYARLRERPSWSAAIRRMTALQIAKFYGPAVLKTFLIAWLVKWVVLTPLIYGIASLLNCSGG